jgi:Ca2+-binding RTX toxin-like protein
MADLYQQLRHVLFGTNDADYLTSNGTSPVYGEGGSDWFYGDNSSNKLFGQGGDDTIISGDGRDYAYGGNGNDFILGSTTTGDKHFYGQSGNDSLLDGIGKDFLDGGSGDDSLTSTAGDDFIRGGTGNDAIYQADPNEFVTSSHKQFDGNAGYDTLAISSFISNEYMEINMTGESKGTMAYTDGLNSPDTHVANFTGINEIDMLNSSVSNLALIYHAETADTNMVVRGASGDDIFFGGRGNETFDGGEGHDQYVFQFNAQSMGHDRIEDLYHDGVIGDISFQGANGHLHTTQTEHDGWTTYTSTYDSGALAHILDVEAIGLPPISNDILIG